MIITKNDGKESVAKVGQALNGRPIVSIKFDLADLYQITTPYGGRWLETEVAHRLENPDKL